MKDIIKVLGVAPSGDKNGTTGYAVVKYYPDEQRSELVRHFTLCEKDYDDQLCYWSNCIALMVDTAQKYNYACVSIEDYVLYKTSMGAQAYSDMPTSKLIGAMIMGASSGELSVFLRTSSEVKERWADHILLDEGVVTRKDNRIYGIETFMSEREVDALRHALHCAHFDMMSNKDPVNILQISSF